LPQTWTAVSPCAHPRAFCYALCLFSFACMRSVSFDSPSGRKAVAPTSAADPAHFIRRSLPGTWGGGMGRLVENCRGRSMIKRRRPSPQPSLRTSARCICGKTASGAAGACRVYTYIHCLSIHTPIIHAFIHPLLTCTPMARHAACSCGQGHLFHRMDARVEEVLLQRLLVACDVQFASCGV